MEELVHIIEEVNVLQELLQITNGGEIPVKYLTVLQWPQGANILQEKKHLDSCEVPRLTLTLVMLSLWATTFIPRMSTLHQQVVGLEIEQFRDLVGYN